MTFEAIDQRITTAAACLLCLLPFVAGWVVGTWFTNRLAQHGFPGALLPDFIRRIFEGL